MWRGLYGTKSKEERDWLPLYVDHKEMAVRLPIALRLTTAGIFVPGSHTAQVGWPAPKKEPTHARSDRDLTGETSNSKKLTAPHRRGVVPGPHATMGGWQAPKKEPTHVRSN